MNPYEITFIIRPDLDEEGLRGAVDTVIGRVESSGGEIIANYGWTPPRRRMAYTIRDFGDGCYNTATFHIRPQALPEIENALKLNESVLRYLIVQATELNIKQSQQRMQQAAAAPPQPQPQTAPAPQPQAGTAPVEQAASATPAPITQEPAVPVVEEPAAPAAEESAAPATEEPAAPATEETAAPATEETAAPAAAVPETPATEEPTPQDAPAAEPGTQVEAPAESPPQPESVETGATEAPAKPEK